MTEPTARLKHHSSFVLAARWKPQPRQTSTIRLPRRPWTTQQRELADLALGHLLKLVIESLRIGSNCCYNQRSFLCKRMISRLHFVLSSGPIWTARSTTRPSCCRSVFGWRAWCSAPLRSSDSSATSSRPSSSRGKLGSVWSVP